MKNLWSSSASTTTNHASCATSQNPPPPVPLQERPCLHPLPCMQWSLDSSYCSFHADSEINQTKLANFHSSPAKDYNQDHKVLYNPNFHKVLMTEKSYNFKVYVRAKDYFSRTWNWHQQTPRADYGPKSLSPLREGHSLLCSINGQEKVLIYFFSPITLRR